MRSFLRILLFVAIGPFVGLVAMSALIGTYTFALSGSTRDYVFGPDLLAPYILLITYTVGAIPALLTGIASIFISRRWTGWPGYLLTAVVGAVVSFIGMWAMFGPPRFTSVGGDSQLTLIVGLAGAVSGLVCAPLFDGLSALRRPKAA